MNLKGMRLFWWKIQRKWRRGNFSSQIAGVIATWQLQLQNLGTDPVWWRSSLHQPWEPSPASNSTSNLHLRVGGDLHESRESEQAVKWSSNSAAAGAKREARFISRRIQELASNRGGLVLQFLRMQFWQKTIDTKAQLWFRSTCLPTLFSVTYYLSPLKKINK